LALRRSDIVEHNNPNLAVVDSDFVKGGFRTKVNNLTELYDLSLKIDEPTASGQMKEHATIVYVISENDYYVLVDIDNIDNHDGWKKFITSGSGGTIIGLTGSTNGLTDNNNIVSLGGNLITETTLNINQFNLILTGTTGSVLTTISSGSSSYVCTNINVNEIILKTNNDLNSAQIIIDKNTNKIIDAMSSGPVIEELNDIITTVKEMINEPPKKFIDKFKSVDEEKIKILNWLISRFDDVQNSFFIEKYNDQKLLVYKLVTDIAIPIRKIDIEFPNAFWHNFDEPKLTRDKKLKEDGWIIIDVNSKMPKIEDLEKELKKYNLFWI